VNVRGFYVLLSEEADRNIPHKPLELKE